MQQHLTCRSAVSTPVLQLRHLHALLCLHILCNFSFFRVMVCYSMHSKHQSCVVCFRLQGKCTSQRQSQLQHPARPLPRQQVTNQHINHAFIITPDFCTTWFLLRLPFSTCAVSSHCTMALLPFCLQCFSQALDPSQQAAAVPRVLCAHLAILCI
jgi:hypothetical protein